jgi:hypothetical protein
MFTLEEGKLLRRLIRYAGWCVLGGILLGAGRLLLR